MKKVKIQKNRGFVILFAMMISSIILMIALGVTNIATNEIKFSSSAKNTNDAFFAADTGAECALMNDKSTGTSFPVGTQEGEQNVSCSGNSIKTIKINNSWTFDIVSFESTWCAKVKVSKETLENNLVRTTIISKGYNIGKIGNDCIQIENSVERQIELTY